MVYHQHRACTPARWIGPLESERIKLKWILFIIAGECPRAFRSDGDTCTRISINDIMSPHFSSMWRFVSVLMSINCAHKLTRPPDAPARLDYAVIVLNWAHLFLVSAAHMVAVRYWFHGWLINLAGRYDSHLWSEYRGVGLLRNAPCGNVWCMLTAISMNQLREGQRCKSNTTTLSLL